MAPATRGRAHKIDAGAKTAELVESVGDREVEGSGCCGSARLSPDGSWMLGWGEDSLATEFNSNGARTFRLEGMDMYRATPVEGGLVTIGQLRAGMDAMHER